MQLLRVHCVRHKPPKEQGAEAGVGEAGGGGGSGGAGGCDGDILINLTPSKKVHEVTFHENGIQMTFQLISHT